MKYKIYPMRTNIKAISLLSAEVNEGMAKVNLVFN